MSKSGAARWVKFFNAAGIPSPAAASYAHIFVENRIQDDMLMDLNKEYIREMGIAPMGDIIAILRHAKIVYDQHARDKVLISEPTLPVVETVATPAKKASSVTGNATAITSKVSRASPPAKPARRVLPEHEGKYKVTMPIGSTDRSKKILAKRDQLYSDRVSSTKKPDVFSRLRKPESVEDGAQEGIVSSSGESSVRVHVTGVHKNSTLVKRTDSGSSSNSVFARLGGKMTSEKVLTSPVLGKEIKSILKNTQRGSTTVKSPIVKAKNIAKPAIQQQKVLLVHKVPVKSGDDSDDDKMEDDIEIDFIDFADGGDDDTDALSDDDMFPLPTPKLVKFASTAEVREIASNRDYKNPRGNNKKFSDNIKSRLGIVSKLHTTRKTYNLKASPTKMSPNRPSPVKGKTIRMRSDEMLVRQEMPVHKRLGSAGVKNVGKAPNPKYGQSKFSMKRYSTANSTMPRGGPAASTAGSVFDRLGFNSSL